MKVHRKFLLVVTLVAAAATPAVGQTTLPAATASAATQGAAASPDFSGIWAHLTWPDVEPPLFGPGPVKNLTRRNGVPDIYKLIGDYKNPILKPQAAETVKKQGEIESSAGTAPTPSNQCWPGGVPFVLFSNVGMQMLQQRDQITILYTNDHEVRHVRMNQQHPTALTPSWFGDSVGHYEGDTLVIDTAGMRTDRKYAMVDLFGTPFTEKLHVVERYRLIDFEEATEGLGRDAKENWRPAGPARSTGKHLQVHFTVEDEGAFTTPWTGTVTYGRGSDDWPEIVCAENIKKYYEPDTDVPTAAKPDF